MLVYYLHGHLHLVMLLHIMHSSDRPPSPPVHIDLTLLPGQLLASSKHFPCCVRWQHGGGSCSGSAAKVMSLAAWWQLGGMVGSAAATRAAAVVGWQRGGGGCRSAVAVAVAAAQRWW
jgi:hypothetical protein